MARDEIALSEIVDALRQDLFESARERDEEWKPLFDIAEATVEVNVSVARKSEKEGGVRAYVLSVGGKSTQSTHRTTKIALRLVPSATSSTFKIDGRERNVLARGKKKQKP